MLRLHKLNLIDQNCSVKSRIIPSDQITVPRNLTMPTPLVLRCCYTVGAFSDIKGSATVFRQLIKLLDLFADELARAFL